MANIYYNEKTGPPEFRVGPLGFCFIIVVLLISVVVLLVGVFIKATMFVANALFCPSGIDNKVITKKKLTAHTAPLERR